MEMFSLQNNCHLQVINGSVAQIEDAEAQTAEAEAAETRAEGTAKLMAAGASLVAVFAFFATFALVLIAMVLGRIEKRLNK